MHPLSYHRLRAEGSGGSSCQQGETYRDGIRAAWLEQGDAAGYRGPDPTEPREAA